MHETMNECGEEACDHGTSVPDYGNGDEHEGGLGPVSGRARVRAVKCRHAAERGVQMLEQILQDGLSEAEQADVLSRILLYKGWGARAPAFLATMKDAKLNGAAMDSIRGAYQTITAARFGQSTMFKNVLLSAVAANSSSRNQTHLARTLGASRYLVKKAITARAMVDESGENFWGGLPRKRRRDALSESSQLLIVSWWQSATTVSPNMKDVKKRRIDVLQFESHPTQYLQESQVC